MSKTIGEIREDSNGNILLVVMHQGNGAPRCIIQGGWDRDEDGGAERLARDVVELFRCSADTYLFLRDREDFDLLSPEDDDGETELLATLCVENGKWTIEFTDESYWDIYATRVFTEYFCARLMAYGVRTCGYKSVSSGIGNRASRKRSVAIGSGNIANAPEGVTLGDRNVAAGLCSVSVGASNRCEKGDMSIAFGCRNIVDGNACAVLGTLNKAYGLWSTAVGIKNIASGDCAVAIGHDCEAEHSGSMAVGINATSERENELVLGGRGIKTVTVQAHGHESIDLLAKLDELERRIAELEGGK